MGNRLVLKDDGLYDVTGKKVRLEVGNKDQIDALKLYQGLSDELNGDGVELEVSYEVMASVNFTCLCGTTFYIEQEVDAVDDDDNLIGQKRSCKCGRKYVTFRNNVDSLAVRFDNK
jgi:hypothetical protein